MDQGKRLTAANRLGIRRFVKYHLERDTREELLTYLIREVYGPLPRAHVYAMAYRAASATAQPLDLDRLRDSRS